ncbi:alpha/beta hydrolase [Anaerococcus murdochii]|uniref:Alpha/beta hydrolase n=1 Tax=Anaerococcus murdochii TaxID=411577 RepID=A0ABS7SYE7_9FIRM|nr:alpha/beta hydrolase [Anaerococcus murdochii]MBZ2386516.1 alpha/beta hydrolase [Anaerococcus murdochii]
MIEKNSDLYPNLGLSDIIEMLNKNDRKRLANASYSTDGVKILSDLSYKDDGDLYHNFDIYYGNSSGNLLPTVVNVHGGGLVYGTKEICKQACVYMAKFGFNVANINYRLLPDVTFRDQIKDVLDGIAYIYDNAYKLNLNPEKIFLTSDSAGSFLTLGAYALMKDENFREIFDIKAKDIAISGMALISPMIGLLKSGSLSLINEPARRGLNEKQIPFTDDILKALTDTILLPTIITTSEEDFIRDQALSIKNFLDDKNIKNIFLDFKKTDSHPLGHGFAITHPDLEESGQVFGEIKDLFKKL